MLYSRETCLAELAKVFSLEIVGRYAANYGNWLGDPMPEIDDKGNIISRAFIWSASPEGSAYWSGLDAIWTKHVYETEGD